MGPLNHKPIAVLVGAAPLACDSGTQRGQRLVWGGRGRVRAALSRAAVGATRYKPVIRAFSRRRLAAGQAKKVALTAYMHTLLTILNTLVHHRAP